MSIDCFIIFKRHVLLVVGLFILISNLFGQIDTVFKKHKLNFNNYLTFMGEHNLAYAAEKFNIDIADARIELAKIFPDPYINFGGFDNGQLRTQTGYGASFGITRTIELGGKRKARINLAASEKDLSIALLDDFFRNLRADASLDFLDGLREEKILEVKYKSYQYMNELAAAEEKRYELGTIMKIDAIQSKVESEVLLNEVFQTNSDFKNALVQLSFWLGKKENDTLFYPLGDMRIPNKNFNLSELIVNAQNNRADILAALKNKEIAERTLRLAKANRIMNLDVQLTNMYVSRISNIIEPTPSYNSTSAGVAMPLKFSNKYKGDLKLAETQIKQADLYYRSVELQIEIEVSQAYNNYLYTQKQVELYNFGLLGQAKEVLNGKIYSYKRGETSLLDVLNAQRTYNGIQLNYYQTLFNCAAALIELERSAGIWDINF